jgi:ABC-type branched-subunit amino acid transport system ATPase component
MQERSRLRDWRERRGFRLEEVADLLGLSVSYLSRLERGQRRLRPFDQVRAARALGARVAELFPVLIERHEQLAGTLSGGEQQMLSLARAVMTRPRLLMVDELSLGLAPRLVAQLFETLESIRREGTTILLVEQYVRWALRLADIVVVLHKGRVRFIGEPGELARSDALAEAYLGGTQAASVERPPTADAISGARPTRRRAAPRGSTRRKSRA